MKRLAVLGSTGSIGTSTLHVARHLKEEVSIVALAAHSSIDLLEAQAREFQPQLLAVYDEAKALELQKRVPHIPVMAGMEGLKAIASHGDVDMVIAAMSGMIGLEPTLAAIESGKDIGLANKETLVAGGQLVMAQVAAKGVSLIPIDSEHSAIFQCLKNEPLKFVDRIILTCSGGPFLHLSDEELQRVTVDKALSHPTWKMGAKITIDSSTLMNKGLEVIEAHWLFGLDKAKIDVVIHPQSIIHSMVEFIDGSMLAQLSDPSMIVPIQYAITYPERSRGTHPRFNFSKLIDLKFMPPRLDRFRCLQLAYDAIDAGGSMPCYMNAANEVLVSKFLAGAISWAAIATSLERLMQRHEVSKVHTLPDILAVDKQARRDVHDLLGTFLNNYGTLAL
jgi:1-deoxy-D-xylulose-5-phosphate reductoisomerase